MIRSMTGFGASHGEIMGYRSRLEIKTLNNRYREYIFRAPHFLGSLEEPLKKLINSRVSRGRVELWLQVDSWKTPGSQEQFLNFHVARLVYGELLSLKEELDLPGEVTLDNLLKEDKLFLGQDTSSLDTADPDELWMDIRKLAEEALEQLVKMRETEGTSLEEDLKSRLDTLDTNLGNLKTIAANVPNIVTKRYQARLEELAETLVDSARLAQEAAILAEKLDITEEIIRFSSHIQSFRTLLESTEPVGRRMEFLLQEQVREANTMGSKSQSLPITEIVLNFKSELEKIREQVLNIE
ncbi:MAG: YicC family protein [Deltaproteobacteria bacterium]|jgi:uncharacterized protein (TIGR00255 family)|nr:YicC family protein [Deltaproteobacteria bacterium]